MAPLKFVLSYFALNLARSIIFNHDLNSSFMMSSYSKSLQLMHTDHLAAGKLFGNKIIIALPSGKRLQMINIDIPSAFCRLIKFCFNKHINLGDAKGDVCRLQTSFTHRNKNSK